MANLDNITYRHYDPVGQCIYCGATGVPLTEEHIIPFSLAGKAVLPASSCTKCATETGRMEQHCCRTMLNRMRYYLKMPSQTRKKRRKPELVRFTFLDESGASKTVYIPVAENPLGLLLPVYGPMRLVLPSSPFYQEPEVGHWRYGPPDPEAQQLMAKHGAKSAFTDIDPLAFARLIAKIGFAFAAAESGIANFTPVITKLILGESQQWSHFVGGAYSKVPLQSPNEIHSILLENLDVQCVTYHIANVRLFSRFGAPSYTVALGTVSDLQYQGMLQRLADRARRFGKTPSRHP